MDSKNASPKTPEQEYTILRIKRKRDEDVPDVLGRHLTRGPPITSRTNNGHCIIVVDKKGGKRRKSGLDVFQFAETIDEVAWKELEQDELRVCASSISVQLQRPTERYRNVSLRFQDQVRNQFRYRLIRLRDRQVPKQRVARRVHRRMERLDSTALLLRRHDKILDLLVSTRCRKYQAPLSSDHCITCNLQAKSSVSQGSAKGFKNTDIRCGTCES